MESIFIFIAAFTGMYLSYTLYDFFIGFEKLTNLLHQPDLDRDKLPSISIILSALNEEAQIEHALTSLLHLDYPNLEVIAINDRSTDNTPHILDKLSLQFPHLRVLHINHLPENWLGKNYALHCGSETANGDWLLFTDADVVMKKDTLLKTMNYVLVNKVDHLTIFEHHLRKTFWLKMLLLGHYITYSMIIKPWRVREANSKKYIGHGAFNLVNKQAYKACQGHRAIALECLDDMKLGKLLKNNGFKQDTVDGRDYVEREWYASMRDMVEGWKKNSFAFFNYRMLPLAISLIFVSIFYFWPFAAVFGFDGYIRWLNVLNIVLMFGISLFVAGQFRLNRCFALFYPCAIVLLLYAISISAFNTIKNKGIIWRGTFYPLKKLKARNVALDNSLITLPPLMHGFITKIKRIKSYLFT